MRVYVAAPWGRKAEALAASKVLEAAGHTITSRWFNHGGDPNDSAGNLSPVEDIRKQALEDIADVCHADCLIVLNLEKSEGKAVETGIALNERIPIISVGPRSNIFQTLGFEVETLEDAFPILAVL